MRVGIFDSGRGGAFALSYFKELAPHADAVLYTDTDNAPYGTKSAEELVTLVSADIEGLRALGCTYVLMACCTASTVYGLLPYRLRCGTVPIIAPTAAEACRKTRTGRIAVISTEATHKSGAFAREIAGISDDIGVISHPTQALVALAEAGECDTALSAVALSILRRELMPIMKCGADTLVLGCTHFAAFERTVARITGMRTVSSARVGACALFDAIGGADKCK